MAAAQIPTDTFQIALGAMERGGDLWGRARVGLDIGDRVESFIQAEVAGPGDWQALAGLSIKF